MVQQNEWTHLDVIDELSRGVNFSRSVKVFEDRIAKQRGTHIAPLMEGVTPLYLPETVTITICTTKTAVRDERFKHLFADMNPIDKYELVNVRDDVKSGEVKFIFRLNKHISEMQWKIKSDMKLRWEIARSLVRRVAKDVEMGVEFMTVGGSHSIEGRTEDLFEKFDEIKSAKKYEVGSTVVELLSGTLPSIMQRALQLQEMEKFVKACSNVVGLLNEVVDSKDFPTALMGSVEKVNSEFDRVAAYQSAPYKCHPHYIRKPLNTIIKFVTNFNHLRVEDMANLPR